MMKLTSVCNYRLECHAFSRAEQVCMRWAGDGCRMKSSYDLQYGVIKKTDTDENLQVEYGDLGLAARMKEISRGVSNGGIQRSINNPLLCSSAMGIE